MTGVPASPQLSPKRPHVVVVGSANTDMAARAARLPRPGETVGGAAFAMTSGGKGANQAVAAARLGGLVTFVACVGADALGDAAVLGLEAEGVDTRFVVRDPDAPTGVALVFVDGASGENSIVVAPGANTRLSVPLVELAAHAIHEADVVVCQLESPLETVLAALKMARAAGKVTILNPAPVRAVSDELLSLVSVLTPNEAEAAAMAGIEGGTLKAAAQALQARGVGSVVVTLGAEGVWVRTDTADAHIPALVPAHVVDTTAAGDCFTGALAVALGEGQELSQAVRFANAAASLSVETAGAQPSLPNRFATDNRLSRPAKPHES